MVEATGREKISHGTYISSSFLFQSVHMWLQPKSFIVRVAFKLRVDVVKCLRLVLVYEI
jgi:hypothetical protein